MKIKNLIITTAIAIQFITVPVMAKEMQTYIRELNNIEETDVAWQGTHRMYYYLDAEINKELDPIVETFKPQGKTDLEKLKSVGNFITDLGIVYSPQNEYNSLHQIENIKYGHTQCLGVTILGSKLLDKTGLEYRFVLRQDKYRNNPLGSPVDGGHINAEVKTDKGKWMELEFTQMLYTTNYDYVKDFLETDLYIANKIPPKDAAYRKIKTKYGTREDIYQEFVVSPSYKQGKRINNQIQVINNL